MKHTHPISIYVRHALTVLKYHSEFSVPFTRMVKLNRRQARWFRSRKSRKRKQALRAVANRFFNKS